MSLVRTKPPFSTTLYKRVFLLRKIIRGHKIGPFLWGLVKPQYEKRKIVKVALSNSPLQTRPFV